MVHSVHLKLPQQSKLLPPPLALDLPPWKMGKLGYPFKEAKILMEQASYHSDQWIEHSLIHLQALIQWLGQQWQVRDRRELMGNLLGQFYAIVQQYPVSQYLDNFHELYELPRTFPARVQTPIPKSIIQSSSWPFRTWVQWQSWQHRWVYSQKRWRPTADIHWRRISTYWLRYQQALQLKSTIQSASDYYFLFLKSIQRIFYTSSQEDPQILCEEVNADIQQLAESLSHAQHHHLKYIYDGLVEELEHAFRPWNTNAVAPTKQLLEKVKSIEEENEQLLRDSTRALEYSLEDFHVRVQFDQIRKEAHAITEEKLTFTEQQYQRLQRQMDQTLQALQNALPENIEEWESLSPQVLGTRIESIETRFFESLNWLKTAYEQLLNHSRVLLIVDNLIERYEEMVESLPEYVNVVHFDKLWSWSHKKIEIDESFPLRYAIKQFFLSHLYEPLNWLHKRSLNRLHYRLDQIVQQEQFLKVNFYTLRQEWVEKLSEWESVDYEALHAELIEYTQPTLFQLKASQQEANEEFVRFHQNLQELVNEALEHLEEEVFDPSHRQKLLRLAAEGVDSRNLVYFVKQQWKQFKQAPFWQHLPWLRTFCQRCYHTYGRWQQRLISWRAQLKEETQPVPSYYSRVFSIEPLELFSLVTGREKELEKLKSIFDRQALGERSVVAVVGSVGMGKHSMIDTFVSQVERSAIKIRLQLEEGEIVAIINQRSFSLERMMHKVQLDRFEIVILEGLESCFTSSSKGAYFLQKFFVWLQNLDHHLFWVVLINDVAWHMIELLDEIGGAFTDVLSLKPLSAEPLKQLLYKRHHVVGLPMRFAKSSKWYWRLAEYVMPHSAKSWQEQRFFHQMMLRSGGNPAAALTLWVQQCAFSKDHHVLVNTEFETPPLPELQPQELLVLRLIFMQGRVEPKHLQTIFISSRYLRVCLDHLAELQLIQISRQNSQTYFSVNPNAYLRIYQLLQKHSLLTHDHTHPSYSFWRRITQMGPRLRERVTSNCRFEIEFPLPTTHHNNLNSLLAFCRETALLSAYRSLRHVPKVSIILKEGKLWLKCICYTDLPEFIEPCRTFLLEELAENTHLLDDELPSSSNEFLIRPPSKTPETPTSEEGEVEVAIESINSQMSLEQLHELALSKNTAVANAALQVIEQIQKDLILKK